MRLRIPPDSGGSFGIKLSVFPYVVLAALAARVTGRPVKWVEDRVEHLMAASTGPNRVTEIEAAVTKRRPHPRAADGSARGLRRLPARADAGPALPHARRVTGAYDISNIDVVNRVVLTNKMPAGLIRGFGGAAALHGAGTAGAAHRGRARPRSSRRPQAQPGAGGEIPVSRRGRLALRFRRLPARGRDRDRRRPARRTQAQA